MRNRAVESFKEGFDDFAQLQDTSYMYINLAHAVIRPRECHTCTILFTCSSHLAQNSTIGRSHTWHNFAWKGWAAQWASKRIEIYSKNPSWWWLMAGRAAGGMCVCISTSRYETMGTWSWTQLRLGLPPRVCNQLVNRSNVLRRSCKCIFQV